MNIQKIGVDNIWGSPQMFQEGQKANPEKGLISTLLFHIIWRICGNLLQLDKSK